MRVPEREVIPEVLVPGDPCAGDEALFEPGSYANFVRFGGADVTEADWAAAEEAFHARVLAVLGGDAPWDDPALLRLAAYLRVDHPAHHDSRPLRVAEEAVPDTALSDIVEDLVPDYAVLTERVTGNDRPPTAAVVSVLFFVPVTYDGRRPLDWWADESDERALVRAARVIEASPPGLFRDGAPLLPTPPGRVPAGPAPTGVHVGRPYRVATPEGWAWSGCVPLPSAPALAPLRRRLQLELWRHRLLERRASIEDMLRARPQVLYRACCEGAFDGPGSAPPR